MSRQLFLSRVYGNADCTGHTECDFIIMDDAYVGAIPEIHANHQDASLVHEAAIGKIAGEQLIKLMTEYYPPCEPPVSRFRATRKFLP